MKISLVGEQSRSLLDDFDAAGVPYEMRCLRPGVIMNAGDAVNIAEAVLSAATVVIVAWIKYAPTRTVMITTPDNKIVQAEGRSVTEVEQLFADRKASYGCRYKEAGYCQLDKIEMDEGRAFRPIR